MCPRCPDAAHGDSVRYENSGGPTLDAIKHLRAGHLMLNLAPGPRFAGYPSRSELKPLRRPFAATSISIAG
jgi:hypothetical protein